MALIKNNQISVIEPFDMNDNRVINVGYPLTGSDATTKFYVDQHIWDSGSGDMYKSVYDINNIGIVDSASFAITASYLEGYDNLANVAYTDRVNYFTGSQVLDTSHDRHVSGDYTYGIFNSATYTGSFRGYAGLSNINTYAPTQQLSNAWLYGLQNNFTYDASYTASGIHSHIQNTKITQGYVNDVFGFYVNGRVFDGAYVENFSDIFLFTNHSGYKKNHYGIQFRGYDRGGTVENMYGLYISDSYFPANIASQSYAIYVEPNQPSYFGGDLQLNTTASYQSDLSSTYNDRTLVDKGWVDSITGSLETPNTASYASDVDRSLLMQTATFATTASYFELPTGLVSGSLIPSASYAPTKAGVVSGSSQISYVGITDIPSEIVSSSTQVDYTQIQNQPTLIDSASYSITASYLINQNNLENVAYTDRVNYFTGSQYFDTSHDRIVGGDYTYGITNTATYTGSYGGFQGIRNYNSYNPPNQNEAYSNPPQVYGIYNTTDATYTGSYGYVIGMYQLIRNYGYVDTEMRGYAVSIRNFNYAENIIGYELFHRYDGVIKNSYGVRLGGNDSGLESLDNLYGLYISSSYFPTSNVSQSYAIYNESDKPSYFGGELQLNTPASYQSDLSSIYNDRTLVDKGWVDSITGSMSVETASYATTSSFALNVDSSWTNLTDVPIGIVSSSTQVDYEQLQNIPIGIVSGSLIESASFVTDPNVAYTNAENRFTGSQYINASTGVIDGNKYSLKIDNTHTGSYASMHGIWNVTKWESTADTYWLRGIFNPVFVNSAVTSSGLIGIATSVINRGYGKYMTACDVITTNANYAELMLGIRNSVRFNSGSITENVKGIELSYIENVDATVIDSYGIYIDISPTAANGDNYAIYSVHNIPSFHSGSFILANTASYQNNYSSFYNDRTLVDKGWVDSITGSLAASSSYALTSSFALNVDSSWNSLTDIPSGIVSSSTQVDYDSIQNQPTLIASASYALNVPNGIFSSSIQVDYTQIQNIPTGILSGSLIDSASFVTDTNIAYINKTNQFGASQNITGSLLLSGSVGGAAGLYLGDGDTGFYESSDDNLILLIGSDIKTIFRAGDIVGATTGFYSINTATAASSTVPAYSFRGDTGTGIGHAGPGSGSLIAGGVNVFNWHQGGLSLFKTGTTASFDVGGDIQATFFTASYYGGDVLGYQETQPVYTFAGDYNTGIAHGNLDQISFVGGGLELASFTNIGGTAFYEFSEMSSSTGGNRVVYASPSGYIFAGSAYGNLFSGSQQVDHGLVMGLADDDHTQYYNVDRLNAYISASPVPNAHRAETASYADDVDRSLLMQRATTASYADNVDRTLLMNNAITASHALTADLAHAATTASFALNASQIGGVDFQYIAITTQSNTFTDVQNYSTDLTVSYTDRSFIDKGYLDSVIEDLQDPTGSTPFTASYAIYALTASYMDPLRAGNDVSDVHMITGSLYISGSLILNAGGSDDYIGIGDDITDLIWITGSVHHTGSYEMDGLIKYKYDFRNLYDDRTLIDKGYLDEVIADIQDPTSSNAITASYAIYAETSSYIDELRAGNHASKVHMMTGSFYISGSLIIEQVGPTIIGDDVTDIFYITSSLYLTGSMESDGLVKYKYNFSDTYDDRTLIDKGYLDGITGSFASTESVSNNAYWTESLSTLHPIDSSSKLAIGTQYASASLHVWESELSGSVLPANTTALFEDESTYLVVRGRNTSPSPAGVLLGSVAGDNRTSFWGLNVLNESNGEAFGLTHATHTVNGNGPGDVYFMVDTLGQVGIGRAITTSSLSGSLLTIQADSDPVTSYLITGKDDANNILFSVDDSGSAFFLGDVEVDGNLIANQYIVSSSITYMTQSFSSGSTMFGDSVDDTHIFTGSVYITGPLILTNTASYQSDLSSTYNDRTLVDKGWVDSITGSISGLWTDHTTYAELTNPKEISAGNFQLINVGYPSASTDAASKEYVDDLVSAASGGDMLKTVYDSNNDGIVNGADSASFAVTASYALNAGDTISGTAYYIPQFNSLGDGIEDSIAWITGSNTLHVSGALQVDTTGVNVFGGALTSQHEFTGSVNITGSLWLNGEEVGASSETASYALDVDRTLLMQSASYSLLALTASYYELPSGLISGSLIDSASYAPTNDGVFSSSEQVDYELMQNVPSGIVSSSIQVVHQLTTNYSASEHFEQSDITTVGIVTAGDVSAILPSGVISGSLIDSASFVTDPNIAYVNVNNYFETNQSVTGSVFITQNLVAATKSFLIDHPTKKGCKLQHGSLEGPEHAVYHRGRLDAKDTINLPEYWTHLVDAGTITVQLTPIGKHQKLFVKEIRDNKVIIGKNGFGKIKCYYLIHAERKDVGRLDVEQ